MITIANYVGSQLLAPAAGRPYALVPGSDAVDLEAAVAAAREAFPG